MILLAQTTRQSILTCARLDGTDAATDEAKKHFKSRRRPTDRYYGTSESTVDSGSLELVSTTSKTSKRRTSTTIHENGNPPVILQSQNEQPRLGKKKSRTNNRVSFDFVHIREHALTIGDHEWCDGESLPITLDWRHSVGRSIGIDDFEWMRQRQGRTPRGRLRRLDDHKRKHLLQRVSGVSPEFVADMIEIRKEYSQQRRRRKESRTVTKFPKQ